MVAERTRFPCLATTRYMVASGVTLLALLIVVKMITVSLLPERIGVSIVQGYVEVTPAAPPAGYAPLRISLIVHNPSASVEFYCDNITARVLDVPNSSISTDQVVISSFKLEARFTVRPQASHALSMWTLANDSHALPYIYGAKSGFQAMVQVNTTIATRFQLNPTELYLRSTVIGHYCWPVTVSSGEPSGAMDVHCNLGNGLQP
uniref:Late embryogenesis abundant protein LEA-2 subgroup domain-containing protein n=1 Tax=Arundo donax TaxID=35708 RepID=A0A0A9C521_ARUDO